MVERLVPRLRRSRFRTPSWALRCWRGWPWTQTPRGKQLVVQAVGGPSGAGCPGARVDGQQEHELADLRAVVELLSDSAFIAKLRSGGTPAVPGVAYTNIVTRYDELVQPYTSGIQSGMTNYTVQDYCPLDLTEHFQIAADPVAAGLVLNALDPAHPRPVPFTLALPLVGS